MIKDFRHKGIERYFKSGSKAGIQATGLSPKVTQNDSHVQPAASR